MFIGSYLHFFSILKNKAIFKIFLPENCYEKSGFSMFIGSYLHFLKILKTNDFHSFVSYIANFFDDFKGFTFFFILYSLQNQYYSKKARKALKRFLNDATFAFYHFFNLFFGMITSIITSCLYGIPSHQAL